MQAVRALTLHAEGSAATLCNLAIKVVEGHMNGRCAEWRTYFDMVR